MCIKPACLKVLVATCLLFFAQNTYSNAKNSEPTFSWAAVTLDNDSFIGNDNGYTSGVYFTHFSGSRNEEFKAAWLTRFLQWSMPNEEVVFQYNATIVGQVMGTPNDITISDPQPDDIPYSGLLFFQHTNIKVFNAFSDKSSVVLGVVGPLSGAEQSQKIVHKLIGADEPQGWGYQIENEPVFQLSRGRIWRSWHSKSNNADILFGGDAKVGTIESSLTAGVILRYGRNIEQTYSTAILSNDRTSNPINIDGGWYVYAGASAAYIANLIYLDGNTFKESPSVDYDPTQFDIHMGFTYAWSNFSVSVALNNINSFSDNDIFVDSKEYGSFTLLWRL